MIETEYTELQAGTTFVPGPLWVRFSLDHILSILVENIIRCMWSVFLLLDS